MASHTKQRHHNNRNCGQNLRFQRWNLQIWRKGMSAIFPDIRGDQGIAQKARVEFVLLELVG